MKYNTLTRKLSMAALAAAMIASPAINVFAAPEDIIDTSKTGSITVHKYDITAATEDGFDASKFTANGKQDTQAEQELSDYTIEGVEFSYMKVADIQTVSENGKVQVMYNLPPELAQILSLTDDRGDGKYTSDAINKGLNDLLKSNTAGKNALEDYIKEGHGMTSMPMTDENGISKASNIPLGLYLIVETKVPANVHTTVDPFFVSVPMTDHEGESWFYDVNVYPKNQTNIPDLDKTVRQNDDAVLYGKPEYKDTTTASEGDKVDYLLVSHLPKITSKATHLTKYEFNDKVNTGLKYNRDAAIYFYNNETDAKANNTEKAVHKWEHGSPNFEEKYNSSDGIATTADFKVTSAGLQAINKNINGQDTSEYSELWMVVSYSALLDFDNNPFLGDRGNTNDVTLTWKRSNMDKEDQLEDRARVFTYGIDLDKKFKTDGEVKQGDPSKVKFSLKNKTDGHYITAWQEDPGSGVYYVTDNIKGNAEGKADGNNVTDKDDENAQKTEFGTVFSPSATGKLEINGLEADEYILTELETDDGYTLLKEPVTISIKATQDEFLPSLTTLYDKKDEQANVDAKRDHVTETNGERASATVDGKETQMTAAKLTTTGGTDAGTSEHARVKMEITNTPGFKLPATGGAGTIAFTVAGCAIAGVGIAMITKKSKKEDDNNKSK